jgi:hypothetical protein
VRRLEGGDGLITGHRGKRVKELLQAVSAFELVDQISERYSSSNKDRNAAKYVGVAVNHRRRARHVDSRWSIVLPPRLTGPVLRGDRAALPSSGARADVDVRDSRVSLLQRVGQLADRVPQISQRYLRRTAIGVRKCLP